MEERNSPIVQICDPVEGECYVLDTRDKVAHRMKYAPKELRTVDATDSQDEKRRLGELGITVESFGSSTIQGVQAKGYKFQLALIHESREVWFAPALGMPIRSAAKHGIEEITEIVNLSLENPAPALFKVPTGYRVRNETGSFTLALGTPR
jgi:hypothetical protein